MNKRLDSEIIITHDDTLKMLDMLLDKSDAEWWNSFYSDKEKPIPFFKNIPDENLVEFVNTDKKTGGKALDIGCGNGRNTIYLDKTDYDACGIDFSDSIEWAKSNAKECGSNAQFICQSFFDYYGTPHSYDLIYDSGCFHHIKPHRRAEYLEKVQSLLDANGYFIMTCFNLDGGTKLTDYDVYRNLSMKGGIEFSEFKLHTILSHYFEIESMRQMKKSDDEKVFGVDFLWVVVMRNKPT